MKPNSLYLLLAIAILFQTSCKSTRDIALFQDMKDKSYLQISSSQTPPEYHIKPFDNLYLSIMSLDANENMLFNPSMAGGAGAAGTEQAFGSSIGQHINGYRVEADGTITLPIIGRLKVSNLTLKQIEERLREKSKEYLQEPTIQVKLLSFKVNILGEVNTPGIIYNYEGTLNIFDAIGNANGVTDFANLRDVVINRKVSNVVNSYKIDLTSHDVFNSRFYYLQPNDLVYIPPIKLKRRGENSDTISLILAGITSVLLGISIFR